jgi:hypothetical protein
MRADIPRIARHDGVLALAGAEHHVDIDHITFAGGGAHQAGAADDTQRHNCDIDVGRFE